MIAELVFFMGLDTEFKYITQEAQAGCVPPRSEPTKKNFLRDKKEVVQGDRGPYHLHIALKCVTF